MEKDNLAERITRHIEIFPSENFENIPIPEEILVYEPDPIQGDNMEELIQHYSREYMESRAIQEI
jgi:hypothetical protein